MNFFEFENETFPGTWTEKTIKELKNNEPSNSSGSIRPDEYYCWQGLKIPCWFE